MTRPPRQGERYRVHTPFEALVMTHWFTAYTGGERRTVPAGLEFTVREKLPRRARSATVKPDEPEHWEGALVDAEDLLDPKYGGYSIAIKLETLAACCARID